MRNALRVSATICVLWSIMLVALPWTDGHTLFIGLMLLGFAVALGILAEI